LPPPLTTLSQSTTHTDNVNYRAFALIMTAVEEEEAKGIREEVEQIESVVAELQDSLQLEDYFSKLKKQTIF